MGQKRDKLKVVIGVFHCHVIDACVLSCKAVDGVHKAHCKMGKRVTSVCVEVIWKEEKRQTAMTLTLIRREDEDLADAEADAVGDVPELVGSAEAEERKAVRGPVVAEEEEAAPAALVGADVRRAVDEEQHHDLGAQVQQTCAAVRVGVADVVKVHLVSALGIVCALFCVCVMLQCHVAG